MRILLVKTSSLGDVVHNLPVASDIRRALPAARIDWLVEEAFVDLPRLHPAVDRVIPVALRRWRKAPCSARVRGEFAAFRTALRAVDYDLVLDTQGLLKSALLARQARLAPGGRRFGHRWTSAREPLAALFYQASAGMPRTLHAVARNRGLASAALGFVPALGIDYGLDCPPLEAGWIAAGRVAVLLSATSRDDKLWPEAHWIALGRRLAEQGLFCILPAGNAAELARAERIAAALPGAIVPPPLGIAELARLFVRAERVVGVDTGLTHLAAALDKPTVALFTASNPALTGVLAGPAAHNLGGIGQCPGVDEVLAVAAL